MVTSQKERMLAGELYQADDPELQADLIQAEKRAKAFNGASADDPNRRALLAALVGNLGPDAWVRPPLRVDYGYNNTDAILVLKDILARVWKGQM